MRGIWAWSCVALLAVQGCATQQQTGDPTVVKPARLREMVRDDQERRAGVDSPRHLKNTYLGVDITGQGYLSTTGELLWALPARLYHFATGDNPLKWAKLMEDTRSPDNRRDGMMELVQNRFARKDPYTKRYAQIGNMDREYLVRAGAIRALNYSRSREGTELFLAGVEDAEAPVRLEAAKALANLPDERAVTKLIAHLQKDDNKDVRVACADALRNFKTIDVARALTSVMLDRDFGVSWQARQSLVLMTGHDYRYDEAAWLDYLATGKAFL